MPFDPNDPAALGNRDYLSKMGGGAAWEDIKGAPPPGYEYDANGGLKKRSLWDRIDTAVMSPAGFAAGIGGMALAPALSSAFGAGGAQVAPHFGEGLVSTQTATPWWQGVLGRAAVGAGKGAVTGGWKGALEGAAEGALPGGAAHPTGGGGMNWLDIVKLGLGSAPTGGHPMDEGGMTGIGGPMGGVNGDDGGETSGGGGPSIWSRIWNTVSGKGTSGRVAGTVGDVASGVEKGRSADRASQNDFNVAQDRTRLSAMNDFETALENRAALDLKQRGFAQDYQGTAYRQAILGALGKNLQDVGVGNVPKGVTPVQFTGGLRPSAVGPEGRAAAALLNTKAMDNLQNGTHFDPLPAVERFTPSGYQKGNALDTALGVAGTVGKVGDIWNQRGQDAKNQTWIDQLRAELAKQKGVAVPTGDTPNYLMIDPKTGLPVGQDSAEVS